MRCVSGLLCVIFMGLTMAQPICDFQNASDVPQTTGCIFCNVTSNEGCQNGVSEEKRLKREKRNEKRTERHLQGTCYLRGNFPLCGCTYGWALFQCAVPAPQPRLCNSSNPADTPLLGVNCEYCHPIEPGQNSGCANGGLCYVRPITQPGAPPNFQIALCGCTYEWDPPTCEIPHVAAPLCDPEIPTVGPPTCEYCIPGTRYPEFSGCQNMGTCGIQNITGAGVAGSGVPPNFQTPVCSCQTGWVPPACAHSLYNNSLPGFGDNQYYYQMRFIYAAFFALIGITAVLLVVEYHVRGKKPMLASYKQNLFGLAMIILSAFMMVIYFSTNQNGIALGYTYVTLWFQQWFVNTSVAAACIAIWVVTSVWISISITNIRNRKGWPRARIAITIALCVGMFGTAIILASYQAFVPDGRWMFLVVAVVIIVMLLFCIVTAIVIIHRIAKSSISNAKARMRRLAIQLITVSVVCLMAIVVLLILVFLPPTLFTKFLTYYWLEVFFPAIVQMIFLVALLFFFRLSDWKSKVQRMRSSGTSARTGTSGRESMHDDGKHSAVEKEISGKDEDDDEIEHQFGIGVIEL